MKLKTFLVLLLGAGVAACATAQHNYSGKTGPRYAAAQAPARAWKAAGDTVRIASFNIQFALHVDSALAVIKDTPQLRDADILLLQEMDERGTQRIADALQMSYVYYPSTLHPKTGRDFGNAVLSRYPIVADSKILLPHISRFRRTQRTATAATIKAGAELLRVYSTHLGTMSDVTNGERRDQLRAILADAGSYSRVVIGGDLNSRGVGKVAQSAGYQWPTQNEPHTVHLFSWDHVFLKGLSALATGGEGTVSAIHHASDHHPIWVRAVID